MRVTTQMAVNTLVGNLNRSFGRMVRYQQELSSGSRLNNLSDDPAAVERSLSLRSEIRNIEQYQKNIDDGTGWLELSEANLGELETLFVEARGLAVQGASDTYDAQQRSSLAAQVDQFLEHAVSLSESRYRGRYIFAGTQTGEPPYDAIRDQEGKILALDPAGDATGTIEREVADGVIMQVNVSGDSVYEGSLNAFDVFIDLRDSLADNDVTKVRESLTALADMREKISAVRGEIGARVNRMELTRNILDRVTTEMSTILSEDEDVDLTSTIVNLQQEQDVFQAALASGSTVIPQSLMDFIG
ncbi:MAG: flagellar hook-associated protein FlgL [Gemmatimonadetes bacterium]|jgi:flagellar hook-associated protein 3 FlgL|nr:flagellar hook-associated protein FlgL [Gemmatimonadota bacterium]MBT5056177.1 flagellar hook-associated protein FlgL [Gemmatimonadota bacterium]MBT5142573.1 flagellar hook-associated protein FlgL [Gemmatimonadota bacterium]MBT5592166.1 flagellar hook-associated protein FlgL [Gemmatimonadota bacterium]MBT5961130.1 flagellar hook-associated protein FlgL [Gemmatimonadota bacterium]